VSGKNCENCDSKKDVPKGNYCKEHRSYDAADQKCIKKGFADWSRHVSEIEGEEIRFGKRKVVKARKDHVCNWCGEKIRKGEHYVYMSMKISGEFQIEKNHEDCDKAMNEQCNTLYKEQGPDFDLPDGPYKRGTSELKGEA